MVSILCSEGSSIKGAEGKCCLVDTAALYNYLLLYSYSQICLKIVWPTRWTTGHPDFENEDITVFLLTVDGVHCQIHEPRHPTMSKDRSYYSHKFHRAALNYELGISVYDNALVWLNGPTKASKHVLGIFKSPNGLKAAGRGYKGKEHTAVLSTPNSCDPAEIRKMNSRARARHESFNAKIKNFGVLAGCF